MDYRQQAQQMELRTGGMSVSTQIIPDSNHLDVYEQVRLRMFIEVQDPATCGDSAAQICSNQRDADVSALQTVHCCKSKVNRSFAVSVVCLSGCPPVLLLPGEEPPPHVPFVERHLQQVRLSNLQPSAPSYPDLAVQTVTQVNVGLAAPTLRTRSGSECW